MAIKLLYVAMATMFLIQVAHCQDEAGENSEKKEETDVSSEVDQIIQHLKDRVDEFGRQIQDNALVKNLTHYVGKINEAINEQGQRIMKKF